MADLLLTKEAEEQPSTQEDSTDSDNPVQVSDAALKSIVESRQKTLDTLFASKKPSEAAERKLVGQQLSHAASGDYESKAPLIEKSAGDYTLTELTRGILD